MTRRALVGLAVLVAAWMTPVLLAGDDLDSGFSDPPDTAKPWAYWW